MLVLKSNKIVYCTTMALFKVFNNTPYLEWNDNNGIAKL